MKTIILSITSAALVLSTTNCSAPAGPSTQSGAVAGGLLGAAAGGIIGHQSGRTAEGALLGAAVGGTTGAVIGNQKDQRNQQYRYDRYGNRY